MADVANHVFLPWVQPGALANVPDQFLERLAADQAAAVSLRISVLVNSTPVPQRVRLYGPRDVAGIDPQQIVRLEPRPYAADFEPNYFPFVEFDRHDFPWLFSPLKADAQGRLRPWIALVVIRTQPGVALNPSPPPALPVLTINPPASPRDELPDLAESYFWAHAQVTGVPTSQLNTVIDSDPARTVSRVICARRLRPSTEYLACLVPAFEIGRLAGLDKPVTSDTLLPSWRSRDEAPDSIELPVYFSWTFRTSADGDFESLVRRLERRDLPAAVGRRPMDISRPGFAIDPLPAPGAPGTTLAIEGALRIPDRESDPWPADVRAPFQRALAEIVDTPWRLTQAAKADQVPVVAPPIYGCWHAGIHQVGPRTPPAPPPFWLDELNLDPRHRVVAAMGTQVVQDQQEPLMASAWEQLGEAEAINQRLRQAQLSRAVNRRYHTGAFAKFTPESFLRIVGPARSRVAVAQLASGATDGQSLLVQRFSASFVPATAVSAQLRKLARPRGPINRPFVRGGATAINELIHLFNSSDRPRQFFAAPRYRDNVTIDLISESVVINPQGLVWVPDDPPHWERMPVELRDMLMRFRLASLWTSAWGPFQPPSVSPEFAAASLALHEHLTKIFEGYLFDDRRLVLSVPELVADTLAGIDPAKTVSTSVRAGLSVGSPALRTGDDLEPIMDAPEFPQPMYEALRDLSQDYLFPGLQHVPGDTVQLLQTNARFVEAYMVGLNHEMSRELLWRGYPTDQRGTYFRQFWDTSAAGAMAQPDIPPLHEWKTGPLGKTAAGADGDRVVLLIRGELLRRYPGTIIYAVQAIKHGTKRVLATDFPDETTGEIEKHPLFRGSLDPDVTFIGFDLTPDEVVDGEGWFFVLQEPPTDPRFGLDDDPFGPGETGMIPDLKTWNDLNWAHIRRSAETLNLISHLPVLETPLVPTEPVKGTWARNSAHMAYITKQLPVRVAIHATDLLG